MSIKDLIKQAKRRTTTEQVCLRGDLAGEYEALEKQLAELPPSNKLGGDPERQRITAQLERIRGEMQDGTVPFVLVALSDSAYQQLLDEHQPRRDPNDSESLHPADARWMFNWLTFPPALIRACVVEPTLDQDDWDLLFHGALSPGQMAELRRAALEVNGRSVDVPFSPAASNGNPTSGQ